MILGVWTGDIGSVDGWWRQQRNGRRKQNSRTSVNVSLTPDFRDKEGSINVRLSDRHVTLRVPRVSKSCE